MIAWTLLILSLPTENSAARMRAWRALKGLGAAVLRDGVYLIPTGIPTGMQAGHERRAALDSVARGVESSGGTAWVLELADPPGNLFSALFDRTPEYQALSESITAFAKLLEATAPNDAARQMRKLRKALDQLKEIDFFPNEAGRQTEAMLSELGDRVLARISPDEPLACPTELSRCNRAGFQGRLWATRNRPWVDRLASAWLISRFIDVQARFVWLDAPADCPPEALGFDFDGAPFSHTETASGTLVTFETLLARFALDADPALTRIARIVHVLDVGGLSVPEAAGLESLLRGMTVRLSEDDALLAESRRLFDDFYSAFQETPP